MRSTSNLYTFGYEGMSLEAFIVRLKEAGVRTVVDVRQLPLSRKKGFSKRSFAAALHASGLAYEHIPALGCPKQIRDRYKDDADWSTYARQFTKYLSGQSLAVMELAKFSKSTSACLICFEADFNYCHRSLVARAVAEAGGPRTVHLTAKTAIPEPPDRAAA